MQEYHWKWLESHPERDAAWLETALENGFDIHHLDGDHENNDPSNLVLIEHTDHMRLHDRPVMPHRLLGEWSEERRVEKRISRSQAAYEMKAADPENVPWREVEERLGIKGALNYAKFWARHNGLPWPLSHYIVRRCASADCRRPRKAKSEYCGKHEVEQ